MRRWILSVVALSLTASLGHASRLVCPENPDASHHREVTATSAPEVKVRASAKDDTHRWTEIIKPLTQKAIKAAKTLRTTQIQEGIEYGCSAGDQYVGQIIPVPNRASGCDTRTVIRPGEEGSIWVQVIAICKYDWACCTPEGAAPAAQGGQTGYTLEGPIAGQPAAAESTSTTKAKGKK